MDSTLIPAAMHLRKGAVRSFAGDRGNGIAVVTGEIWLTQDNDPHDWVLEAGESFTFDGRGRVVIQALGNASLLLLDESDGQNLESRL